jgi:hypothetical protein
MPVPYAGSMRVRVLVAARRNQPTEHIMKRHITLGLAMLAGQSKSSAAYAVVDIGEMTDPNLIWEQLLPKVTPAPGREERTAGLGIGWLLVSAAARARCPASGGAGTKRPPRRAGAASYRVGRNRRAAKQTS